MPDEILAVTKTYDILMWLIPQIEKFPRAHKFTIGDRIENHLLDLLELLIKAVYTRSKKDILREANLKLEVLRYLIRISKDLKFLSLKRYEYISQEVNELGKQIGGWIRQQRG